jgi:hypothetical protein
VGVRAAGQVGALAVFIALAFPALAAAGAGGRQLVGYVNAMRDAHGIPAGITENPVSSFGCSMHNRYGALNDVLTHSEDPIAPGYTEAGAAAGAKGVLYRGMQWTADSDPFAHAPIHLHQLLAPRLDSMGAAESHGFGCATVGAHSRRAPAHNVTYTYPVDGMTGWQEGEVAEELPFTPGELIGIRPGTATGPYLYVLFDGPGVATIDTAQVTSASLTGPAGPVPVASVDNTTRGLAGYLPVGAQIIPRDRLAPGTTYTARITAMVGAMRFRHRWSFTTGGGPPPAPNPNPATAARSADTMSEHGVRAVRNGATILLRASCPRSCLVRGIGRLSAGDKTRFLPYARAGRLNGGTIQLRFRLNRKARRWIAAHPFVRFGLSVSGLFVQPMSARLAYARTSGSSSAYLPLASSVPSSG